MNTNISWTAVVAAVLGVIALASSAVGATSESFYLIAHGGVCAILAVSAAILSLKDV